MRTGSIFLYCLMEITRINLLYEVWYEVDSVGYYFVCRAEGELLKEGDHTHNPRWVTIDELAERIQNNPLQFINIDYGLKV